MECRRLKLKCLKVRNLSTRLVRELLILREKLSLRKRVARLPEVECKLT